MAGYPMKSTGKYLASDAWTMASYGANNACSFIPVRRVEEPVSTVGPWRGTVPTIFFIDMLANETGKDFESKFSPLLKLANQSDDTSSDDLFTAYVNIIRFICPGKDAEIRSIFQAKGYDILNLDEVGTKIWYHDLNLKIRKLTEGQIAELGLEEGQLLNLRESQDRNDQDIDPQSEEITDDEREIPLKVLCWVLGVYFNLITKKITALNLDNWYKGRIRAYSRNTNSDVDESLYLDARPSVKFAEAVNSGVAGCFRFKRTVFYIVREIAMVSRHPLSDIAIITMGYFKMAELTSFGMVVEYVLTQNPVLLTWNGVAKHLMYFKAALDKYRSLGSEAPYCKLIYPPEDLAEFKGERIGILTNIAHDIATQDGRSTLSNLKGVSTHPLQPKVLDTVRRIISLYGGAITHSVAHSREGAFARLDVDSLLAKALNSPATEDDQQAEDKEDPAHIPGVDPRSVN